MKHTGTVKIGCYELGRVWLAPMAGYTDIAFRELCREAGAGLTPTEMVSVRGFVRGNAATGLIIRTSGSERPSCIQLFGSNPDDFARAAEKVNCGIIDINMGCPMPKIVKNGDGSALLLDPERAGKIVSAILSATDKPVTVKTRLGYRTGELAAAELVDSVQSAGAAAVTVHGRFAEQRYAGSADIEAVKAIKKVARIPIIYNGDVDRENIDALLSEFSAVAVGRAALKDIGIFSGEKTDPFDVARRHVQKLCEYFDERYTVNQARKFFVHYFKGVVGGKAIRDAVNRAACVKDVLDLIDNRGFGDYN